MDRLVAIAVCLVALSATATDYYVTTNGNNAADGSISTPWSNIWYSATQAAAGDTVHIGPGTFREFITNTASGSDGSPITFQGTRSGTNWLTIIDPSTDLSTGWVAAPEAGSNVYKITGLAFTPRELSITNQRVAFVYTTNTVASNPYGEGATWLTNGIQFLQLATDQTLTIDGDSVTWWDSVSALYTATNNAVYLRLRDGSDPEGMEIRGAPNRDTDWNPSPAVRGGVSAIWISEKSHIVWRDVAIRNAYAGIVVIGTTAHDITIVSNYIQGGHSRIVLQETPYNCYIYSNTLTTAYYGTTNIGAWEGVYSSQAFYMDRRNSYEVSKYLMGQTTSFDEAIRFYYAGSSNKVVGNHIYSGLGSAWQAFAAVTTPCNGTEISHNTINNFPSTGVTISAGSGWTQVHDNYFTDCNGVVRFGTLNTANETNRTTYVYRNTSQMPDGAGNHMFFHWNSSPTVTNTSDLWIYHNSFSGGDRVAQFNEYMNENGGVPGLKVLDNLVSGNDGGIEIDADCKAAAFVGAWDWDYHYPAYPAGILWMGTNNIIGTSNQWVNAVGMSFALPSDSQAIDAALDLSTTFSAAGQSWPALPDTATKVGAAWDIGALEYSPPPFVNTNRVQYTEDLWIK